MNFLGKILIVLIFAMSLFFMAFSVMVSATHRNWKDEVENPSSGLKAKLSAAEIRNSQLESERTELVNQLQLEKASRASTISALETRSDNLASQLQATTQQLNQLNAEKGEQIQIVDRAQLELSNLVKEVTDLRGQVTSAHQHRDQQFDKAVGLEDKLNSTIASLDRIQRRNEELSGRVAQMKQLLQKHDLDENAPLTDVPPRRDGVVRVVRENNRWVEISLGTDEGLRPGHQLDVHRNDGTYLGRIEVRRSDPNRSVAEVLPELRNGIIRKGDRVITKVR